MLIKDISNIDLMTIKKYTWKPRKQKEQLRKRTLTRKTNLYGIQNNIIHKISIVSNYIYISSWDLIKTLKANPTIKEFE